MTSGLKPGLINNKQFRIFLEHIPTQEKISFDSWLTAFTDDFNSEWNNQPVYGRMDDLYTFGKTSRNITIAFDVVAADAQEAYNNQFRLNRLTQFLYPVYSESVAAYSSEAAAASYSNKRSSQVLLAAPLLRMKFNGLVQNSLDRTALVGFLRGFTYSPNIEQGQFFTADKELDMVYQTHQVSLTFVVLHTHLTGWVRKSTTDASTLYSFGSAETAELDNNFPHGGAGRVFEEGEFQRLQGDAIGQFGAGTPDNPNTQQQSIWGAVTDEEANSLPENSQAAAEELTG